MTLIRASFLFLVSVACTGGTTDTSTDTGTGDSAADTAETGDSGGDTDTDPTCSEVTPGDGWAWSGDCPQMNTPVAISVDGCELTLDYESVGGMTMGMPYSATIDGDQVTFADDNSVDGCTGTVDKATKITGSCKGGCTYTLRSP